MRRRMTLTWIGTFDSSPVCIVLTSRPAGIELLRERLGELGFAARRVAPLAVDGTSALLDRVMNRFDITSTEKDLLIREIERPQYKALAQSPFMLTLLAKVLASKGVSGGALSVTTIYDSSLELLLDHDSQKAGGDAGMAGSLRSLLRAMGFWNILEGLCLDGLCLRGGSLRGCVWGVMSPADRHNPKTVPETHRTEE